MAYFIINEKMASYLMNEDEIQTLLSIYCVNVKCCLDIWSFLLKTRLQSQFHFSSFSPAAFKNATSCSSLAVEFEVGIGKGY